MKTLAVSADVLVLENEAGSMYKTLVAHADRVCGHTLTINYNHHL